MSYCKIDNTLLGDIKRSLKTSEDLTFAQIAEYCMSNNIELWYDDTSNLEHDLITNAASSEYGNWKIVSVCDDKRDFHCI